jgi:hypothetical protein
MENNDGFLSGHIQIQNAPFMIYLEKVRLHTRQLLTFQLYLALLALQFYLTPFVHVFFEEPS